MPPIIRESVIRLAEKPVTKEDHSKYETPIHEEPSNETTNGLGRPKTIVSFPDLPQQKSQDETLPEPKMKNVMVAKTEKVFLKDNVAERTPVDVGKAVNNENLETPDIGGAVKIIPSPLKVDNVESKERVRSERMIMPLKKRELPKDLSTGDSSPSVAGDDGTKVQKIVDNAVKSCIYQAPTNDKIGKILTSDSIALEVCERKQGGPVEGDMPDIVEPVVGIGTIESASDLCASKKSECSPGFATVSGKSECRSMDSQTTVRELSEKREGVEFIDTGQEGLEKNNDVLNQSKDSNLCISVREELKPQDNVDGSRVKLDQHSVENLVSKGKERSDSKTSADGVISKSERDPTLLVDIEEGRRKEVEPSENKCDEASVDHSLESEKSNDLRKIKSPEQRLDNGNVKTSSSCLKENRESRKDDCGSACARNDNSSADVTPDTLLASEEDTVSMKNGECVKRCESSERLASELVAEANDDSKVDPVIKGEKSDECAETRHRDDSENHFTKCSEGGDEKKDVAAIDDKVGGSLKVSEEVPSSETEHDAGKVSERLDVGATVTENKESVQSIQETENEESERTISKVENDEAVVTLMENDSVPSPPPERRMTRSFRARQNSAITTVICVEKEKEISVSKDSEANVKIAKDDKVPKPASHSKVAAPSPKSPGAVGAKPANKSTDQPQTKDPVLQEIKKRKWGEYFNPCTS